MGHRNQDLVGNGREHLRHRHVMADRADDIDSRRGEDRATADNGHGLAPPCSGIAASAHGRVDRLVLPPLGSGGATGTASLLGRVPILDKVTLELFRPLVVAAVIVVGCLVDRPSREGLGDAVLASRRRR